MGSVVGEFLNADGELVHVTGCGREDGDGPRSRAILPPDIHLVVERDPAIEKAVSEVMSYMKKALMLPGVRGLLNRSTKVLEGILARNGIDVSDPKLAAILAEVYRRVREEMVKGKDK
jgi:hypothetical protein